MSIQAKVAKVHQFVNDSGTMNGNICHIDDIDATILAFLFSTQQLVRLLIRD